MAKEILNEEIRKDPRYPQTHISDKRKGGKLNNWRLQDWAGKIVAIGSVANDSHWGNEPYLTTSLIVSIDREAKVLETLNTVYELGDEYVERVLTDEEKAQAAALLAG